MSLENFNVYYNLNKKIIDFRKIKEALIIIKTVYG